MKDGYVALLDVLGFSALVGGDPNGSGIHRYLDCLQRATGPGDVDYVVFSDSIMLTAKGSAPESLVAVAGACSRLFADLLTEGIPIRGAIAFGSFFRSRVAESVFVAGRAVIDAYQFEKAQDWIGVMVAPSALARVADLEARCSLHGYTTREAFNDLKKRFSWAAFLQKCPSIPFHSSNPFEPSSFDGFAVVPTSGVPEPAALRNSIQAAVERLRWLRAIAPTPNSQHKYEETLRWLGHIQRIWDEVVHWHEQFARDER